MLTEPPPPPPIAETEDLAKSATLLFQYMESQISFADSKAEIAVLAQAFLASSVVLLGQETKLNIFDAAMPLLDRVIAVLMLLLVGSFMLSTTFALLTARPRITRVKQQELKPLFYFGYITELAESEFIARFSAQTSEELHKAILSQVYAKAHIARAKFERMRISLNFLIVAVILWALVLLLLGFKR